MSSTVEKVKSKKVIQHETDDPSKTWFMGHTELGKVHMWSFRNLTSLRKEKHICSSVL